MAKLSSFSKSTTGRWPAEWEFEKNFSDLQTLVSTRGDGGSEIKSNQYPLLKQLFFGGDYSPKLTIPRLCIELW